MSTSCKTTRLSGRDVRYAGLQNDRIRKLLLSEYRELSETILVESPFAETTRNGRGLRQVTLGLTRTRLIVAADILHANPSFFCPVGIDVSVESFELVSVYPLEYVALSIFRRKHRRTLDSSTVAPVIMSSVVRGVESFGKSGSSRCKDCSLARWMAARYLKRQQRANQAVARCIYCHQGSSSEIIATQSAENQHSGGDRCKLNSIASSSLFCRNPFYSGLA